MVGEETLLRMHADIRAMGRKRSAALLVPEFLLGGPGTALVAVNGPEFLASCVLDILNGPATEPTRNPELVYSIFIPTFASFGERAGSLLSLLPFLSFLRRELCVDTVISLPLNVIGSANRKGTRGSPFAAADPFAIDPSYADGLLPSWSAHDLYVAVIEAARSLGIRFGSIVPLATLGIDSPLLGRFPDLSYWWQARSDELLVAEDNGSAPAIAASARARFALAPASEQVSFRPHGGGQVAFARGAAGEILVPANAVPDVSPAMNSTYTWEDVVSVNYTRLAFPVPHARHRLAPLDQGRSAWRVMPEVVAWHLRHGERALLIDVQSSVPEPILARGIELAYSEAELSVAPPCCPSVTSPPVSSEGPWIASEELWTFTGPERADAVVGPFLYCAAPYARDAARLVQSLDHHVDLLSETVSALPFLAGSATHDTIPVGPDLVRLLLLYLWFLPGAVPFLFSGTEHGITLPINREFGFSVAEQDALTYDQLQMFSPGPMDWNGWDGTSRTAGLLRYIRLLLAARSAAGECLHPGRPVARMTAIGSAGLGCLASGYSTGTSDRGVVVGANFSSKSPTAFCDPLPHRGSGPRSLIWAGSGPPEPADGRIVVPARSAFAILPVAIRAEHPDRLTSAGAGSWRSGTT